MRKTQLLIRLISNKFIHYHLQPNFLAGLAQNPWSDLVVRAAVMGSWTSVSRTGTAFYCRGRGGGEHSAVTCLTQCVRDTLGPGKTTLTSENEAIWNFYQDQTSSSRRQDSLGLCRILLSADGFMQDTRYSCQQVA